MRKASASDPLAGSEPKAADGATEFTRRVLDPRVQHATGRVPVPRVSPKPLDLCDVLADQIRQQAGEHKRIGFVSGNFNVLHPGHLRLLKFAAENADFLVVAINPDTTPGVAVPAEMRLEGLQSIAMVNYALILQEPPERFITRLKPEIVVKGKEHQSRLNAEKSAVEAYGGKLLFSSGEIRFSSLSLLDHEYRDTNYSSIQPSLDYPDRHGFTIAGLKSALHQFAGMRVLVIGDLIVDTYITCDPLGMSQEDPTIVVTPIEQKTFVGGAGIVSAHARGLGAEVRYLSVVGADEPADFVRDMLNGDGIQVSFFVDETRPTTIKQRYRALGKTLLRVNHLRQHAINPDIAGKMLREVERLLPQTDLLLFSDFNYGCLPQTIVDQIVKRAGKRNIMMAADSQASSQLADISRFNGMSLITPTEREARLALQDFESGLIVVGHQLRDVSRAENVVITLAAEGLLVHGKENGAYSDDRLPAFNTAPKDVAGAGDSFFTCASLALRAGVDIWRSAYLGALAAACQVSRVGNLPLHGADIEAEIDYVLR
jgi:rfaE bifunctional protein kinase chain/domain